MDEGRAWRQNFIYFLFISKPLVLFPEHFVHILKAESLEMIGIWLKELEFTLRWRYRCRRSHSFLSFSLSITMRTSGAVWNQSEQELILVVSYCGIHHYRHLIPVHPINRGASPTQPAPTTVTKEIPGAPTGGTFDHPSKPEKNVSLVWFKVSLLSWNKSCETTNVLLSNVLRRLPFIFQN